MDKGGSPLVWLESYAVGGLGQMIPDISCSSGHAYCAGLAACPSYVLLRGAMRRDSYLI